MKKLIITILTVLSYTLALLGQDIIAFKNGDIIKVKVLEINQSEIKYKKYSNPDGPTYTIDKVDVLSILYKNGEKEVFNDIKANSSSQLDEEYIFINPNTAPDNEDLKKGYASVVISHKKKTPNLKKIKTTGWGVPLYGFTPESILSDSLITVSFELADVSYACPEWEYGFGAKEDIESDYYTPRYKIVITNKSDNIIYVDIANCFRIDVDGKAESFYNTTSVARSSSSSKGLGLNLGAITNSLGIGGVVGTLANGIGIGGGKTNNNITISENDERILSIPPKGSRVLPEKIFINSKKTKSVKNYEYLYASTPKDYRKEIEKWTFVPIEYQENEDSKGDAFLITYSTNPNFKQYTSISFTMRLYGIFGVDYPTPFKDLRFTPKQGLVGNVRLLKY